MTRKNPSDGTLAALAVGGSVVVVGGFLLAVAASSRVAKVEVKSKSEEEPVPPGEPNRASLLPAAYSAEDVEAAARMVASENPLGSVALQIEQIWTQLRSRKAKQSLFDRITAGSGYGPQGTRVLPGGVRPVATDEPAQSVHRQLAREVLEGKHPSRFPTALSFFEPEEQDRILQLANAARAKQAKGIPLLPSEKRLLGYRLSAAAVRAKWSASLQLLGTIDHVEFYGMSERRMFPERTDFLARDKAQKHEWPIAATDLLRVGDSVTDDRDGKGRPHEGVDLFAAGGTLVRAARSGKVRRVMDGSQSSSEHGQRAGLWIDVQVGAQLDRYLHLGEARVKDGQKVKRGEVIGTVAEAGTSGTGKASHLHFEVRASDWDSQKRDYGEPINPKFVLV